MNDGHAMNTNDVPENCQPTIERLQRVLDGEEPASVLAHDAHAADCLTCQERIMLARWLVPRPAEPAPLPTSSVDHILAAVAADRSRRTFRTRTVVAGFALAASVLVAIVLWPTASPPVVKAPPKREPSPEAPRISEAFADAGQAIQGLGESLPGWPEPIDIAPLAEAFAQPVPMADLEPAAASLAELPEAALRGLEPVTGSASRVLTRLIEDVSVIPAVAPPKAKS